MHCTCKKWNENIDKIDGVLAFHQVRMGILLDFEAFSYCPWCGKKLEEKKDETNP